MTSVHGEPNEGTSIVSMPPARHSAGFEGNLAALIDGVRDAVIAVDREWRITFLNAAAVRWLRRDSAELLGQSLWSARPELGDSGLARILQDATAERRTFTDEIHLPGLEAWSSLRVTPSVDGLLIYATDVTDQKRREERIAKLHELTTALSVVLDRDEVASVIVEHTRAMMGANLVVLAALSDDQREFETLRLVGYPEETIRGLGRVPANAPMMFADAVRSRQPIFVETWGERVARYPYFAETPIVGGHGAAAAFPLLIDGRPIGALGFGFPTDRVFTSEERDFLQAIADLCAQALERSRLYENERDARAAAEAIEASLRESEERFRTTFDQAAVGMAHVSLDGRWLRVNDRLGAITGYSRDELLAGTFQEITHPDDLETDLTLVERLMSGEIATYTLEKRYIRKDGSPVWINLTVSLARGRDGSPGYFISVIEDITERKRFEERLRQSEERLRIALGGSSIVVYQQDRDLRYTWLYNYSHAAEEDILGKTDAQLLPPEEAAELIAIKRRVLDTGNVERAEVRATTMQHTIHYDLTVEPVHDESGTIVGITGSAVDITAQKMRVERIARLQELTAALAGAVDAEAVAKAIVDLGVRAVGAATGIVTVVSADGQTLATRAMTGFAPDAAEGRLRFPVDDPTALADACRRRTPIFLASWRAWVARYPGAAQNRPIGGTGALAALPLLVEGHLIGVLGFGFPDERPFDGEARDFLLALADLCGQALERARLYDAERQARDAAQEAQRRLSLLLDVTAALSEAATIEEVVEVVLTRAIPAVDAQGGTVTLVAADGQAFEIAGSLGMPQGLVEDWHRYPLIGPYPLSDAARTAQPVWIERPEDWEQRYPESYPAFVESGFRALASVPLLIEGRLLGGIGYDFRQPRWFGRDDRAFMTAMSHQVAQALDRARIYEMERTARSRAQAAEARYRDLFERSADAVLVVDERGRFRDANPAALALLSYDRDALLALTLTDLTDGAELTGDSFGELFGDDAWHGEFEVRRKDGSHTPIEARATAMDTPSGRAVMISARDISERRDLEKMQQDFFASVSHDLKNPLAALKGQVQLLQRRARRKGTLEAADLDSGLQTIHNVGERMSGMIEELVDVAQLRGGNPLTLKRQATDLVALAEWRVREHQQVTTRHQILLETSHTSITGWWDEARLSRVIDNLLMNAVKYSMGGQIAVRLQRESRGDDDWAVLKVEDNGVGIPTADLPHIFERFRRGSNVRDRFAGTGLGLSGVREIVVQHGGDVTISSAEGVGTTVTVALPRGAPPQEECVPDA